MRHARVALGLAFAAALGFLFVLAAALLCPSAPSLAARLEGAQDPLTLRLPPSTGVTCTLTATTTDSLPGNNSFSTAAILADYTGLALVQGGTGASVPASDDYFRLDNAVVGWTYEVEAIPDGLGNYNLGMVVYNASYTPIMTDTNPLDGTYARIEMVATTTGPYYVRVFQYSDYCSGGTYHLNANAYSPTPTPTGTPGPTATPTSPPPPGPTSIPGADRFEPNYDFEHAAVIATNVDYANLNFVPWADGSVDNDFYRIWVKPGLLYTCETFDLGPGVDTNMILYDHEFNVIAGNDDVELGDYRSRLSYFSTYEGFLYILVGHGGRIPIVDVQQSTYSLRCAMSVPGTDPTSTPPPTGTPSPGGTATPPLSPLPTPSTTPTPSGGTLAVRLLATPSAPETAGTPSLHFTPVDLLVYYDANGDGSPGAGEGVAGMLVLAYDTVSGDQIAQGLTDELGSLQFTAAAQGLIRLSIPYLGVSYLLGEEGATVYVRVPPVP